MSGLLQRVSRTVVSRDLLKRGDRVVIAVSGGVDSMVLLHMLHALAPEFGWQLTVAHLNHRLRGRDSDADARLVLHTARKLKLKCVHKGADVKRFAVRNKLSVEMAARELRHRFLAQTARRLDAAVALAHHADDQLELFFLRLLRGSDDGLSGLRWKRSSPADSSVTLIRPLLEISKAELLDYAREQGISYREDASNASAEFQRNQVRLELLPLLKAKYQPALNQVISRVAEIARGNSDYVTHAAEQWLAGPRSAPGFDRLHMAVQRRCLQLQLFRLRVAAEFDLVERLRTHPEIRISVGPEAFVRRACDGWIHLEPAKPPVAPVEPVELNLEERSEADFARLQLSWKFARSTSGRLPVQRDRCEIFDADRVGNRILLRHWVPGDRFQPIGMPAPVKLQDLFINAKIPREERHWLVVASTGSGELFWVERLRISEAFKVKTGTIRRLLWHWKPRLIPPVAGKTLRC